MSTTEPRARDDLGQLADAVEQGELPLQQCGSCEAWAWFPRVACPSCFANALEWRKASGVGKITAVATVHRTHHEDYEPYVPIVLALVELEEGPQMVASLVGDDRLAAAIGDRVSVARSERWAVLPQFKRDV
jgi:uncharacterized OB-fold protein